MNCPVHPTSVVDPAKEGAKMDFSASMSYGDYLQIDTILSAQKPLSPNHNEMLFIIQHQTSELWMKLMLHEMNAAIEHIATDQLSTAFKMLARRGLPIPSSHTQRDWTQPYVESQAVEQAWLTVYRDTQTYWDLYQLGEELTDLEDAFRLWRFRHVTTVERVIGFKRGSGGTNGVGYLRKMLDVVLFPEIWKLRTDL